MKRLAYAILSTMLCSIACRVEPNYWGQVSLCPEVRLKVEAQSHCDPKSLSGADSPCDEALDAFAREKRTERSALPAVLQALKVGTWRRQEDAAIALGNIGDATTIPALEEALASGDFRVRTAALRSIGAFGDRAKSAAPLLERLTRHWSLSVRRAAVASLRAITGGTVADAGMDNALASRSTGAKWTLSREGQTIVLADAGVRLSPTPPLRCVELASSLNARDAIFFDNACMLACADGEFGGALLRSDHDYQQLCRFTDGRSLPYRFVPAHGSYIVISGTTGIGRLSRDAGDAPTIRPLAMLPGILVAYGLDANGDPVFFTRDLEGADEGGGSGGDYALRLTSNGDVVSWP